MTACRPLSATPTPTPRLPVPFFVEHPPMERPEPRNVPNTRGLFLSVYNSSEPTCVVAMLSCNGRLTDTKGPRSVRCAREHRRAPRHRRSRVAGCRAEARVAGLANALEDPVRAVHHTRRADALRVVRHERVRGVAARVVGRVDAVLRREAAKAAESPSRSL